MFILTNDGELYNLERITLLKVRGGSITAFAQEEDEPFYVGRTDTFETRDAAEEEIRKIALAAAYGAMVYEIGKGILLTSDTDERGYGTRCVYPRKQQHRQVCTEPYTASTPDDMQQRTPGGNLLVDGHEIVEQRHATADYDGTSEGIDHRLDTEE